VRRRPYSVVLFDEVEKAHPDVMHMLLQILEEGRLTDSLGRQVDFRNTVVIMTSNLGSQLIRENFEQLTPENREETIEKTRNQVFELLKQTIRPEFLNRIDELIMFTPLTEKEIESIVNLQLDGLKKQLATSGIQLQITPKALEFIAEEGYDPQFGARPVKRVIQKYLLNDLSKQLIAGTVNNAKPIIVDFDGERLVYKN
jgi:ATP-dependent Clp protease ATP-binding subunit ClpB